MCQDLNETIILAPIKCKQVLNNYLMQAKYYTNNPSPATRAILYNVDHMVTNVNSGH